MQATMRAMWSHHAPAHVGDLNALRPARLYYFVTWSVTASFISRLPTVQVTGSLSGPGRCRRAK
jgi:hypothetical protein